MIRAVIANKIISEVKKLIKEQMIIVDRNGFIIASTKPSRIGNYHEGAFLACQEKKTIPISKNDEALYKGVKAGICLPIFFQHEPVGAIGITGNPSQIWKYGELLKKMTELLLQESYYAEQLEWEARAEETFVFDWLQQKNWSDSFIDKSKLLKINLTNERRVAIAQLLQPETVDINHFWTDLTRFKIPQSDDLIIRWGNDRILILLNQIEHTTKEQTACFLSKLQAYCFETNQMKLAVGVGQPISAKQLRSSYEQAEKALKVALSNQSIVFEEELELEMCFQEISLKTKRLFVERTIGPLLDDKELIDTIRAYFQMHQSLKETSQSLHIHINTLHYRLKKIEELTNLRTKNIRDLVSLFMSLHFLDEYTKKDQENT
ncbi:CdaR family transcriptional regulator [Metabacillus arenae]|uniref:Helix-turn-helix domain-containing protein n=1 Tax=Metabacillus arenae TaxID=2771434 RepID=A0A926RXN8_9BACI|nr:sugar diacid recognition domain-containing protein [Metabacillus arenae]MBD1380342.1 helix-turn-helix domain-containing protein [Metabacillus arenae]